MMRYFFSQSQGFTLLEMLVVLVIIGLIAGIVGPRLWTHADESKVQTANIQVKMIKGAVMTLYLHIGRYPTDEEGLALLRAPPSDENIKSLWKGPYLDEEIPLDPWNHAYQYSSTPSRDGQPFSLYSLGADGQPGGVDYNADIGYLPPR
jgi:general secretion pathway protein G